MDEQTLRQALGDTVFEQLTLRVRVLQGQGRNAEEIRVTIVEEFGLVKWPDGLKTVNTVVKVITSPRT